MDIYIYIYIYIKAVEPIWPVRPRVLDAGDRVRFLSWVHTLVFRIQPKVYSREDTHEKKQNKKNKHLRIPWVFLLMLFSFMNALTRR